MLKNVAEDFHGDPRLLEDIHEVKNNFHNSNKTLFVLTVLTFALLIKSIKAVVLLVGAIIAFFTPHACTKKMKYTSFTYKCP